MTGLLSRWRAWRAYRRRYTALTAGHWEWGTGPSPASHARYKAQARAEAETWLRAELARQVDRVPAGDGLAAITGRTRRQP